MKPPLKTLLFTFLLLPVAISAQEKDTLIKKLDSLSKRVDTSSQKAKINENSYNEQTRINFRTYFILLGSDLKQQFSAPFHVKSKGWSRLAKFGLLTAGVLFTEEPINHFAVDLRTKNQLVVSTSKYVTNFGGLYEIFTLTGLTMYGLIFKNEKIKTTTLLATQAYLTSGAIEHTVKFLTGRQRPSYYDPMTNENEAIFHGPFYQFKKKSDGKKPDASSYSSFPSGHATVAFAAATVFAKEYADRPLVPIISYSVASLIALSRLTENKHWASDVLVGAALGYLSGKQVVDNYHRYAKLQSESTKKKNTISFNLEYSNGILMPGFLYKFR